MSKELISIIIPIYNHAHTIKNCVDLILKQTYRPIEIIIVNDGSTDGFNDRINSIVNSVEKFSVKIKVINQENQGAPVARNRGFDESKGEYVIFWDADTEARKEMLEVMHKNLIENPKASFVYSGFKFGFKKFKALSYDKERLKKFNYIDVTSLLRREDFPRFDESLKKFQDWDLWLTIVEKNKIGICVPKVLYKKIVKGREGISSWLPKVFYRLPVKNKNLEKYRKAKEIIYKKHQIN